MEIVKEKKQKRSAKTMKDIQAVSPHQNLILLDQEQIQESIRKKAYEFYALRGAAQGHDVEDWVAAEQFVLQNAGNSRNKI